MSKTVTPFSPSDLRLLADTAMNAGIDSIEMTIEQRTADLLLEQYEADTADSDLDTEFTDALSEQGN